MNTTAEQADQRNRELFFSLIGQQLGRLYHFVRHRLAYLRAVGDLMPGELTPEDVVDAVVVRAYREFVKDLPDRKIRARLIRLAREHLEAEVRRFKSWRGRRISMEKGIPETPPTERVSTLGDEIPDFYEPDQALKIEDVILDIHAPTPEQVAEAKEFQWCVDTALAGMPREWRRVLHLRYVSGLAGAELAGTVGRSEPEVQRVLEHARQYLRQGLVESGCTFTGEAPHV